MITSNSTGTANAATLTVSADGDGNDTDDAGLSQLTNASLSEIQAATDAQLSVNGIDVVSSTNTVTDAIPGATLELLGETSGNPVTITVKESSGQIESLLTSFIDSYNKIINYETKQNDLNSPGPLAGDFTLRSVSARLSSLVLSFGADSQGTFRALSDVGVRMGDNGQLQFDSGVFRDSVKQDAAAVEQLLRGDGGTSAGIFGNLFTAVQGFTDPVAGAIHGRTDGLNANIKRINQQIDLAEIRIAAYEKSVKAQFANLELLMNNLQTQGTALTNALSNLPAIRTGSGS